MNRQASLYFASTLILLSQSAVSWAGPPTYEWSGFYIGAHAGGGWGDVDAQLTSISGSYDVDGFLAGAQAGWNWQSGPFVLGAVVDASFADIDGKWVFDPPRNLTSDYNFLATGRVRAGFAFDQVLIYGTGGLALANIDSKRSSPAASSSDMLAGYAIGAGAELALSEQWSVQIEYLHREFENQSLANYTLDHEVDTVTIGANLKLQ